MQNVILITGLVSLGALLTWMFWAASRILKEDRARKRGTGAPWVHSVPTVHSARALRFKDIRAREAERMSTIPEDGDYLYEEGYSVGWPEEWADDLMLRRN